VEQTLARFWPNVLTAEVLKRYHIPAESFNASFADMMRGGIERLRTFQQSDGGWGWYGRDGEDAFMTAHVVHGLSDCARLGYAVDATMLDRGRARLRAIAAAEQDLDRLAYETHVLGEGFDRLLAPTAALSSYARALLVLALKRANRPEAAAQARALAGEAQGDHWTARGWRHRWENVDVETTCYAIQALHAVDPKHPLIPRAAEWLLAQRNGNRWRSTKDTAAAIATLLQVVDVGTVAAAAGTDAAPAGGGAALIKRIGVRLNGGGRREVQIDLMNPLKSAFEAHVAGVKEGGNALAFEALDAQADFRFAVEVEVRTFEEGIPKPAANGVEVRVNTDRPLDRLRIGDEVVATVTVKSGEPVDYAMVLSPIPAGCEVVRGSGEGEFAWFEARYEQGIFFLRALGPAPVTLRYRMRCAFAGSYSVLPAWAGLMYNEEIHGTGAAGRAEIKP
jgi:uncharacterized protein YfaS (alpha-2-macroglobulin family)